MGNVGSFRRSKYVGCEKEVKILHGDGGIESLKLPVRAKDVMDKYPGFWICDFQAFYIGRPPIAMPSNEMLKGGHAYFVLPVHSFQKALTASTVASLIAKFAARVAATNSNKCAGFMQPQQHSSSYKPFKIQKKGGSLHVKISSAFISDVVMANREIKVKSYKSRNNLSSNCAVLAVPPKRTWKPKLSTIFEASSTCVPPKSPFFRMIGLTSVQ